MSITERKN